MSYTHQTKDVGLYIFHTILYYRLNILNSQSQIFSHSYNTRNKIKIQSGQLGIKLFEGNTSYAGMTLKKQSLAIFNLKKMLNSFKMALAILNRFIHLLFRLVRWDVWSYIFYVFLVRFWQDF